MFRLYPKAIKKLKQMKAEQSQKLGRMLGRFEHQRKIISKQAGAI